MPFDPNDPSTWGPAPRPTEFVGNVPPGNKIPRQPGPGIGRRMLEFAKDVSGYSAIDALNREEYDPQKSMAANVFTPQLAKAMAAIGSFGLGKFIAPSAKVIGGAAGEIGNFSGNALFNRAAVPITRMGRGGTMYEASTPFGKALASTRIMTPQQFGSAQKALLTVAGNTADFGAKAAATFASDAINALARQIASKSNAIGAGMRFISGLND